MELLVEDLDDDDDPPRQRPNMEGVGKRFDINRLSSLDYLLLDQTTETSEVYWLFLVAVQHKWYNWQVILSVFDPSLPSGGYPVLDREIWSTMLYSDYEGVVGLCPRIISLLEQLDVNYPVELTYTFGGQACPAYLLRRN
jgi:hypothetical protein